MSQLFGQTITSRSLPFDKLLNGMNSENAQDAIEELISMPHGILNTERSTGSSGLTRSAQTFSQISGMVKTPAAGRWLVIFNARAVTTGASTQGEFQIYKNDIAIVETLQEVSCNLVLLGGLVTISLNTVGGNATCIGDVLCNGTDVIDVKWRSANGGTVAVSSRVLYMVKVNSV